MTTEEVETFWLDCDSDAAAIDQVLAMHPSWIAGRGVSCQSTSTITLANTWTFDEPSNAGAEGLFVDLGPYLDGTARQERPSVAEVWPDFCLFYAGRLNELHAEPGVGKTNILMAACISVLNDGGTVLYIDPEDTPRGFTTRMCLLGADPEAVRTRVFYLHNPTPEEVIKAQLWAKNHHPTIVILDGLAEAMTAVNADEDKAKDVLPFFRRFLRPFAELGAAVVIADHVAKSAESRGQFARGSGAKAGRYDGVSYSVECGTNYAPGQAGYVKLKVAKDRNGGVGPRGAIVAEVHFTPSEAGTGIEFRPSGGPFRPTELMEKIRQRLAGGRIATKTELRKVGGKGSYIDMAVDLMTEEGELHMTRQGSSHLYSLAVTQPFDIAAVSRVPGVAACGPDTTTTTVSPCPTPLGGDTGATE